MFCSQLPSSSLLFTDKYTIRHQLTKKSNYINTGIPRNKSQQESWDPQQRESADPISLEAALQYQKSHVHLQLSTRSFVLVAWFSTHDNPLLLGSGIKSPLRLVGTTWLQQSARSVYLKNSRVIDSYLSLLNYTDSFNSLPPSFGLLALKVPTSEPPDIWLPYKFNLARKLIHCTNKSICTCRVRVSLSSLS